MPYGIHPKTEIKKGQHLSSNTEFKKGQIPHNKGKHPSQKSRDKMSESRKGIKLSEITKSKMRGHFREKSHHWKGGRTMKWSGYVLIYQPNHPLTGSTGYILEHRLIVEKHLNRYLAREEIVHHINGIKNDNRIENLYLFSSKNSHTYFHKFQTQSILKSNLLDLSE